MHLSGSVSGLCGMVFLVFFLTLRHCSSAVAQLAQGFKDSMPKYHQLSANGSLGISSRCFGWYV